MELTKSWKEPKVAIWYYVGTKEEFHHFLFRDLDGDKLYRIKVNELEMKPTFPVTKDQKKWQVMPWGPPTHRQNKQ